MCDTVFSVVCKCNTMAMSYVACVRTLGFLHHNPVHVGSFGLPFLQSFKCVGNLSQTVHRYQPPILWRCGTRTVQTVRCFHTTRCRQIPPVLWMFVKPVAKAVTIISGRYVFVYNL